MDMDRWGRGRETEGKKWEERNIPRTTAPTGNIHIPIPDVGTACGTDVFRAVTLRPRGEKKECVDNATGVAI